MRRGSLLSWIVLLLLFLGFTAWGARAWQPSIICSNQVLSWLCGHHGGLTSTATTGLRKLGWLRGDKEDAHPDTKNGKQKQAQADPPASEPATETDAGSVASVTEPHPFPWPVADAPVKWTNVRKMAAADAGASDRGSPGETTISKTVAHGFPWPIADAPKKWTNVRAAAPAPEPKSVTEPHPFPWPIADAPKKWTNVRAAAPAPEPKSVTEPHPFPWPIADAPKKWTNVRAAPAPEPTRAASDCSAELNRIAGSGVILFETASAKIDKSSYETLDTLADVAKSCQQVTITVEGHTDDRGSAAFNQRLSEQRAASVAAYLQGAGLSSSSVEAVGYGESRPKVPNDSRANRAKNRRIEFSAKGL